MNSFFRRIILISMTFFTILMLSTTVNAASFSASITKTTISKGGTTTLTVKANNAAGMYKVSISDTSILSVSSGSTSEFIENGSAKIVLKAKKPGTVKVTATALDMTDSDNSNKKVTGSKTYTIKVTDSSSSNTTDNTDTTTDNKTSNETKKSTNANLSTLGVTPKEYDFTGFSSSKTSYSVTVSNDVDSLKVSYKTADSKATVKVTGNTNLEVGTNTIKVVVTAEDGKTTKTYTIKVTKLASEDSKPGNVIDEENDLDLYLTSLNIKGLELTPEFSSDIYSYETTIDMDNNDMSEAIVEAIANDEKATVEITGNTNLVEGENLINVIVKASGSSEQTVYQITVNKISKASEIVSSNNIIDKIKNIKREYLIIGGFIFIVVVILVIIIIKYIRDKKYYGDYEEEDEEDFYNSNLDTTEGEERNSNLVEELFKKRNNGEELNKEEKETIEDIENENDRIFNKPKKGETVEYNEQEQENNEETSEEDCIEERMKRRKGKHF